MHSFDINEETLAKLRALRLWHWQQIAKIRRVQYAHEHDARTCRVGSYLRRVCIAAAQRQEDNANFHLSQVQLLNEFFPMGDTAENDDSKSKAST